jgi:hypothetical protein
MGTSGDTVTGPTGDTGPTGGTGPQGFSVLEVRNTKTEAISINDDVTTAIGTLPAAKSVVDYFRGGVPLLKYGVVAPFTYSEADPPVREANGTSTFVPAVSEDGMLTITQRDATDLGRNASDDVDYTDGTLFAVTVTDKDEKSVDKDVMILRNRPPVAPDGQALILLTVGTQSEADTARDDKDADGETTTEDPPDNATCATFDACKVTPTQPTENGNRDTGNFNFRDDMIGLTFSATAQSSAVSLSDDDKTVTVTGMTSTYKAGMGHTSIPVRVRATDGGSLYIERDMLVNVDGVPTVKDPSISTSRTFKDAGAAEALVRAVLGYFDDAESGVEVESVKSSNENVATVEEQNADIMITPKNPGPTTITIRVAETTTNNNDPKVDGLGQWVEATISVTVTD